VIRGRWGLATAVLGLFAASLLISGVVVAYITRDQPRPLAAALLLGAGSACGLLAIAAAVWIARSGPAPPGAIAAQGVPLGDDYDSPPGRRAMPAPAWWAPLLAIGSADLAGGPAVSGWFGLAGVLILGVSTIAAGRWLAAPARDFDRSTFRAALRLAELAEQSGRQLVGTVEPIGRGAARVIAVAADGSWRDAVLASPIRARLAAELAGVRLVDPDNGSWSAAGLRSPLAGSRGPAGSDRGSSDGSQLD
jgi:hypothetical protein